MSEPATTAETTAAETATTTAATTAEASTATTATRHATHHTRHHTGHTHTAHHLTSLTAAEGIETVDNVYHSVTVDAVILGVGTLHSIDRTAVCAHLVQHVIELYGNGECIAFEEALRYLCIPNQFVGVHRTVVITSTALVVEVC